jgi:NCS1 family nucleobase:cation symporter-1
LVDLSTEADKSAWPLLPSERNWGAWRLAIALGTAAAATWCYVIGEYEGYYLNFRQGAAALTAGCMIGMLLAFLAAGPICGRFGIDSIASTKPQFGARGPSRLRSCCLRSARCRPDMAPASWFRPQRYWPAR